ncbi:hypothetical protein ONS95_014478 [Cadophora gregata]|uniref:uncharacterized protein n=1 Tax=Cadophora gregata TaxID=51156 RepID=UPI0026DCCD6D|nr:uncharacterized protein ONS95_014478 [Cadophora gregata]KAK0112743.1 hypothetical protein ONS95_014478 [Cadophora gregata]KAK0124878.1 hypothetical protein ONS96_008756 [Cadophora gregata f. sp. sojae]
MGRTMREASPIEFPELAEWGLKARNVEGDGNCLFRALSDQLYGHQDMHKRIRAKVIRYMEENREDYKPFHNVDAERGARRNELRSTRKKGSTTMPSPAELEESWLNYLEDLRQLGTWASQLEVRAFAKTYDMDVKIHLDGTTHGHHDCFQADDDPKAKPRRRLHLAFKNQHYQSVRNIQGPHTGPAKTLPFGDLTYRERLERYESDETSSSEDNSANPGTSTTLPTPPRTPGIAHNPLAFMEGWSDSEDETEKKPVAKGPALNAAAAKRSTPPPCQNPELQALFSDSEPEEEKISVVKKPVKKEKKEEKEEKEDRKRSASPSPSPTPSRKRRHSGLSFLGSDSESSDEETWGGGIISAANKSKRTKLR